MLKILIMCRKEHDFQLQMHHWAFGGRENSLREAGCAILKIHVKCCLLVHSYECNLCYCRLFIVDDLVFLWICVVNSCNENCEFLYLHLCRAVLKIRTSPGCFHFVSSRKLMHLENWMYCFSFRQLCVLIYNNVKYVVVHINVNI